MLGLNPRPLDYGISLFSQFNHPPVLPPVFDPDDELEVVAPLKPTYILPLYITGLDATPAPSLIFDNEFPHL